MTKTSFLEILKRSDKKIEEARALRITGAVYDEQAALLAEKRSNVRRLENELDEMMDLSVSNTLMAVNRIHKLDGKEFVSKMQSLKVALEMAKVEHKIAVATMEDLFSDYSNTIKED